MISPQLQEPVAQDMDEEPVAHDMDEGTGIKDTNIRPINFIIHHSL